MHIYIFRFNILLPRRRTKSVLLWQPTLGSLDNKPLRSNGHFTGPEDTPVSFEEVYVCCKERTRKPVVTSPPPPSPDQLNRNILFYFHGPRVCVRLL